MPRQRLCWPGGAVSGEPLRSARLAHPTKPNRDRDRSLHREQKWVKRVAAFDQMNRCEMLPSDDQRSYARAAGRRWRNYVCCSVTPCQRETL
jgi:hypothetical protein